MLMGNYAAGKYARFDPNGDIYTPQFKIIGGAATFTGALSGVTGTFKILQSPGRADGAAGYDLLSTGIYFYDGTHPLPYIELGAAIT